MKIVTISDVHGLVFWKEVVKDLSPEDHVVFLGDYFDKRGRGPYARSEKDNFLEICNFARNNPNVHLLMGNHDFQYTPWDELGTGNYEERKAIEYSQALMNNINLINIVYIETINGKGVIFSHAGVTQDFMDILGVSSPGEINTVFKKRPDKLDFIMEYNGEPAELHGDNIWQTPIWIRPDSLLKGAVAGYDQVVGHTYVPEIEKKQTVHGDTVYFTCTFDANCLVLP